MEKEVSKKVIIRKSELVAKDQYDYKVLQHEIDYTVPCEIEEKEETVEFNFHIANLTSSEEIKEENEIQQYQFLINLALLKGCFMNYSIEFVQENIYYDDNYLPYILVRDLPKEEYNEAEYLFGYKCFVCGVLHKKYNVKEIRECGLEVIGKNVFLKKIIECNTADEIVNLLKEKRSELVKETRENMITINRDKYFIHKIATRICIVVLSCFSLYLGYHRFFVEPIAVAELSSYQYFVRSDYVKCTDVLKQYEIKDLDLYTKYILAYSYAKQETLSDDEVEFLVAKIDVNGDVRVLNYWIYLGRMDYTAAQNEANSLSDDRFLIYAYTKEYHYLKSNTSIDGGTKQSRLSELQNEINELGSKYESIESDTENEESDTTGEDITDNTEQSSKDSEGEKVTQ